MCRHRRMTQMGDEFAPQTGIFVSGWSLRCGRPRIRSQSEVYVPARRRFQLVLIKPSHYDDDGYVIRWWRAMIPSNSLAALYGIAADCAERQVLGPDIAFAIEVIDETNTRVNVPELLGSVSP